MEDSSLTDKIHQDKFQHIQGSPKVNDFITSSKTWDSQSLIHVLCIVIINKSNAIRNPISNIHYNVVAVNIL